MEGRKILAIDALSFGFRSILAHMRLFCFILLAGSGLLALVVGLAGLLNKDIIQSMMSSPMFQNFKECAGSNCFTVVYQSGLPLVHLVFGNIITLAIAVLILAFFFVGIDFGFKAVALDIYDHNASKMDRLFSCFKLAPQGLVTWVIYCVMVWIGFMLLVIPGFIVLLRFAFFPFFMIDKHAGIIESLKMSYHATRNRLWDIFAFWVALKLVVYVCFLSWIGIVLTWPLSTLAYTYVYRHITATRTQL